MESDIDKEETNSEIEPEDLQQKLNDGWKLVDVREDDEWMYGHHSEAEHIKMGDITAVSYTHLTLPTNREV